MSRTAWPLARFAALYVNAHLSDGAIPVTPYMFIPGLEDRAEAEAEVPLEQMPFEEIESNFRSYDAWYKQNHPELRLSKDN